MTVTPAPIFDQLFDYRTRLLARLESQPAEVAERLADIPEAEWYRPRGVDGRSLHELAAHVRDVEQITFLPRLGRILREDHPSLAPFTARDRSGRPYQAGEPMTTILAGWSQARAEVLDLLPVAASPAWSRTGFHPPSGMRTLQWWAERIYRHAQQHLLPADTPQPRRP